MIRVHRFALIQQRLIADKQLLHLRLTDPRRSHFVAGRGDLCVQVSKALREIFEHGAVLCLIPHAELTGVTDAAVFVQQDLAVEPVPLRVHQQVHKRRFAASVAADQRAMPPGLYGK